VVLLLRSVCHSYLLGLGGRVNLMSLPNERTRQFYEHRGFTRLGENDEGMVEFELDEAAAQTWLSRCRIPLMGKLHDDFCPVTGGVDLPKSRFRDDMDRFHDVAVGSDLDRHIVQLLALHPKLRVRFRKQDLTALDTPTKKALLADINCVLGVRSLRKSP
jgi:hypothetical protein